MKEEFDDKVTVFNYKDYPPDFTIRILYESNFISKEEFEKRLRKIKIKEIEKNNANI